MTYTVSIGLRIPEILETEVPGVGWGGGVILSAGDLEPKLKKVWGFKDSWGSWRRRRKF